MQLSKLQNAIVGAFALVSSFIVLAAPNPVGQVTLSLGEATIVGTDGVVRELKTGDSVFEKDLIHTARSGHVHVRFLDDALVSVRPLSKLHILRYEYDVANPKNATIQFELEEGIVRSISGEGAKAAKERFRFNTPIAAIGVRGTDFFASAAKNRVSVLVNEGAVVVAPFSSDCDASGFGPCVADAMELKGGSDQFIEVNVADMAPQLRSANDDLIMKGLLNELSLKSSAVNTRATFDDELSEKLEALSGSFDQELFQNQTILASRQLSWGRWDGSVAPSDNVVLSKNISSLYPKRLTVGNHIFYLLAPMSAGDFSQAQSGILNFAFANGQAEYQSAVYNEPMNISNATLAMDLASDTFTTQIDLLGSRTGLATIDVTGVFNNVGNFSARTQSDFVIGSVSPDGSEAAYAFRKELGRGDITGLTLWNKVN